MAFKASEKGIQGTGLNILTTPYLGPAVLKSFELKTIATTDDCAVFTFVCDGVDVQGNNVKGLDHQEVIWAPNDNDTEENIQKKTDRVSYIVSHMLGMKVEEAQALVLAVEGANWKDYVNKMIALANEHKATEQELSIKVPGSTYGKYKVKFPGYFAFIANKFSSPLTWSKGELDENAAYLKGESASATDMNNSEAVANIEEADF